MTKRKVIEIDEEKCNGCGVCIPTCREGALQIVDGKAKLVSDRYCDGLGACLGHCPQGAIRIVEKEASEFDEKAVAQHLKESSVEFRIEAPAGHEGSCPSARAIDMAAKLKNAGRNSAPEQKSEKLSELINWPVQLKLVPVTAPYLQDADLLVAADCVAFSLPDFHEELLRGKILLIACPKLDDVAFATAKLAQIIAHNNIKSLTIAHMEVSCCFGLKMIVEEALESAKKNTEIKEVVVSIEGKVK